MAESPRYPRALCLSVRRGPVLASFTYNFTHKALFLSTMIDPSDAGASEEGLVEPAPSADFDGLSTVLDRMRLRYFPVWAFLVMVVSATVVQFLPVSFETSPGLLGGAVVAVTILGWVGWEMVGHRLHLSALFGPVPRSPVVWGTVATMVVAMELFENAEFTLLFPWLEETAPLLADWYQVNAVSDLPRGTWAYLARVANPVLVAPLIEELFFRGLLYQRWARSWGRPRWALAASAIAFAAVHGNVVGTLLFAVVATFLYLQSRSLWAPVVFHAAANGLAALGGLPIESGFEAVGIRSEQTIGMWCFALAIPLLGWFLWNRSSFLSEPLPYIENLVASRLEPPLDTLPNA